ncbi:hypothetical protein EV360DRAFT_70427 [Lentinula raphanica]|nr:hypothetical protein EV360DRAFT_70427 [Lentinula raphanica]
MTILNARFYEFHTADLMISVYRRLLSIFLSFELGILSIIAAPVPIHAPNDSGMDSADTLDTLRGRQSSPTPSTSSRSTFFDGARGRSEPESFSEHMVQVEASMPQEQVVSAEYIDNYDPEGIPGRETEKGHNLKATTKELRLHPRADRVSEIKREECDIFSTFYPRLRELQKTNYKLYNKVVDILEWREVEKKALKEQRDSQPKAVGGGPKTQIQSRIDLLKFRAVVEYLIKSPKDKGALQMFERYWKLAEEIKEEFRPKTKSKESKLKSKLTSSGLPGHRKSNYPDARPASLDVDHWFYEVRNDLAYYHSSMDYRRRVELISYYI